MKSSFNEDAYNTLIGYLAANMQVEADQIVTEHPEFLGSGKGMPVHTKPLVLTLIENHLLEPLKWAISRGAQIASSAREAQPKQESYGAELKEAAKAGGVYFQTLIDGYGTSVLNRMPLGPNETFQTQVGLGITWGDEVVLGKILAAFPEQASEVSWDGKTPMQQIEQLRIWRAQPDPKLDSKAHLIRVQLSSLAALEALSEMQAPQGAHLRR